MNKINLENYNEFEEKYITNKFDMTRTEYDNVSMPLVDVAKYEDCTVDEKGDIYYPAYFSVDSDNRVKIDDYALLTTKEQMLSAWTKEESIF